MASSFFHMNVKVRVSLGGSFNVKFRGEFMSIQSIKAKFKQLTRKDIVIAGLTIVTIALFVQKANLQEELERTESNYRWEIGQLESTIEAKQKYIEATNSNIEGISNRVSDFEYEDWRYVVPDVYQSVKELERNIEQNPE